MTLTKQDIDALVDGMDRGGCSDGIRICGDGIDAWVGYSALRRNLYLAAGLTATGERKPERVRCWMYVDPASGQRVMSYAQADEGWMLRHGATPGWFVLDSDGNLKDVEGE